MHTTQPERGQDDRLRQQARPSQESSKQALPQQALPQREGARRERGSASRPRQDANAADALPALLRALAACDAQDEHAILRYLALDARQRRVVRSLIAELARHAGRRRDGG